MTEFRNGTPLDDPSIVTDFETSHGIMLPILYKDAAISSDGGYISPSVCNYVNPETSRPETAECSSLIPFIKKGPEYASMDDFNDGSTAGLPAGVIGFGLEPGGYIFGFDYRTDPRSMDPSVVLVHMDNDEAHSVIVVATSFDAFLASLVEPPALAP